MAQENVLDRLSAHGVVPVVALEQAEAALPLADALLHAGLPIVEITFRTPAAAEAIRIIARERPQMLVGAGTVLIGENLAAAKASGAAFAVAPGLNPEIVEAARGLGLPFVPGVATPSEIERALSLDCRLLKFFPAEALGGAPMLQALAAPYKHTGVRFLPTGGVNPANLESYLKLEIVSAVGGTWLARKEDLAHGNWDELRRRSQEALASVARIRPH